LHRDPALRAWHRNLGQRDDKSPLKPPGDEYLEMDAAQAWGRTLDQWYLIHPLDRAKMVAFHIFKGWRESFELDRRHFKKKPPRPEGGDYERMMALMH
jgi:hypothetical protein